MPIDNEAAKTATSALQAIPFSSLIGGPLDACISAQAKAAQTSWEFIDRVGLTKDPKTGEKKAVQVSFQYNKNGEMVNLVVPLLTIVPIPFLAIEKVLIDFKANISAASSSVSETSSSEDISGGASGKGKIGWGPFSLSVEAHANYSSKKDSKASQESKYSVEYTMDVHVEGGQADMPAGLATILNILQASVTEAPAGGGILLSPKNAVLQAAKNGKLYLEATVKNGHGVLQKECKTVFRLEKPAGLTLKLEATRGTQQGIVEGEAVVLTDEKGVAGLTISVDDVTPNLPAALIKVNVSAAVDDGEQEGKTITATSSIRTTAALPGPKNTLRSSMKALDDFDPASNNSQTVMLTVLDSQGNPVKDCEIVASGYDVGVCSLSANKQKTNDQGQASFTVKKEKVGTTMITFTDASGAETLVNVNVSSNKLTMSSGPVVLTAQNGKATVTVLAKTAAGKDLVSGKVTGKVRDENVCKLTQAEATITQQGQAVFEVVKEAAAASGVSTDIEFTDESGARLQVNVSVQ